MPSPIRFIFALHNHQPIGNFGHLFERSYQESYLPFLDVFSEYPAVKLTLHTSGSLVEWLAVEHPEYLDRLAGLVAEHRVEIVGGPFFEPVLAMLPSRDRIGQIRKYGDWLRTRLGASVRGIWTPERVWEQSYVRDLAEAGIEYTILDDSHFKNAGVPESALWKHYLTEDEGKTLCIFPGSEPLRYLIPFRPIEETLEYFARQSELHPGAVLVHGDDGEKFGNWPETYGTVFGERWLHRFFQMLSENADWVRSTTPGETIDAVEPLGTVYLPDGSYREMTEWVLPPESQNDLRRISKEMEHHGLWPTIRKFIRGGFWRNFKVRYPESNEMYARMMYISARLQRLEREGRNIDPAKLEQARESLYRGQCNCGYWHGAFGGVYLPHLRNAVFRELIQADEALDAAENLPKSRVETEVGDFNFDARSEIKLENENLTAWFAPHSGGTMYELDLKSIAHNLLATMTRRPEPYHTLIQSSDGETRTDANGNRIVFKQEGLHNRVQYDSYPRKSLVDLFYDADLRFETVRFGNAWQHGSFVGAAYDSVIRKKPGRLQVLMSAEGIAYGAPIRITKGITLNAGGTMLEVAYRLENLPRDYRMHFAIELNFAGMPGGADDRYFQTADGRKLGDLGTNLDLYEARDLALVDDWLGLKTSLVFSRETNLYAFPIESVSQSDGGFELVHQSVCVQPHWLIEPDENGTWEIEFDWSFETAQHPT